MPVYRLSAEAVADLESIGEFGVTAFGLAQALKYLLALESRFELLAQFPRIGLPTYDLSPGLYRFPYMSHVIFYNIAPDDVFIVRVLHGKADFKRHFDSVPQ
jgi:toxin ParE1/3/4